MKVTHCNDEHLVCLSSDEVALLVDLCHAGAFSDELAQGGDTRRRLKRFLGRCRTRCSKPPRRYGSATEMVKRHRSLPLSPGAGSDAVSWGRFGPGSVREASETFEGASADGVGPAASAVTCRFC